MRLSDDGLEYLGQWWATGDGQDPEARARVKQLLRDLALDSWGHRLQGPRDNTRPDRRQFPLDTHLVAIIDLHYEGEPDVFTIVTIDSHAEFDDELGWIP